MNRVTTATQRRAVLNQIDRAERRMLPPGWDTGLETQFGSTLTDPAANAPTLTAVHPEPNRYEEATQALGQQRHPMPGEPEPTRDLRHIAARAILAYLAIVAAGAAALMVRACA